MKTEDKKINERIRIFQNYLIKYKYHIEHKRVEKAFKEGAKNEALKQKL